MDTVLLILYIALLLGQTALLAAAIRRPAKRLWLILFAAEVVCTAGALALMLYYNSLPGSGMMPGLTYFAETVLSMSAALVYGVLLVISAVAGVIVHTRR